MVGKQSRMSNEAAVPPSGVKGGERLWRLHPSNRLQPTLHPSDLGQFTPSGYFPLKTKESLGRYPMHAPVVGHKRLSRSHYPSQGIAFTGIQLQLQGHV